MLQNICLTIFSLLLVACAQLPAPPKGEICTIDLPREQLICVEINGDTVSFVNFKDTDKFVSFSPETWIRIQEYIDLLKDYGNRVCD